MFRLGEDSERLLSAWIGVSFGRLAVIPPADTVRSFCFRSHCRNYLTWDAAPVHPLTNAGINYRAAWAADAGDIASIHVRSWRDAYATILEPTFLAGPIEADRQALWAARLESPSATQLVRAAQHASLGLIGFICAYRNHDPQWGSLVDNLHVLPVMRGQSIGERLLRSAAQLLEIEGTVGGLHLWVFEANTAGLRFYKRLGGRVVERDVSRIPAAGSKPLLRVHWPAIAALG